MEPGAGDVPGMGRPQPAVTVYTGPARRVHGTRLAATDGCMWTIHHPLPPLEAWLPNYSPTWDNGNGAPTPQRQPIHNGQGVLFNMGTAYTVGLHQSLLLIAYT